MSKPLWKLMTIPAALLISASGSVALAPYAEADTRAATPASVGANSAASAPTARTGVKCPRITKKQIKILKKRAKKSKKARKRLRLIKRCKAQAAAAQAAGAQVASISATSQKAGSPTVFGLSANSVAAFTAAENAIGVKAGVVGVFTDWKTSFPTWAAKDAALRGAALLISWEPQDALQPDRINQPAYRLDNITRGDHDAFIRQFARDAAATGRPVIVRWAAEMNGDWHPWSTGRNGNGDGDYVAAYRHVVDVARSAGGANIKWMFNPNVSYPGSYPMNKLYPGSSYVDWAGLDGYNFGNLNAGGWQSYSTVYNRGLAEIKTVAGNKPLAITEIGCNPGTPENKAAWIIDAFERSRLAGVKMFVWFEHNKETDWRLSSNSTVVAAAHRAATMPGWIGGRDFAAVRAALFL